MLFLTCMSYVSVLGVFILCLVFSRQLLPFLVIPAVLATLRFVGEVMQEGHLGPMWARHHLGDVGAISGNMIWGVSLVVGITALQEWDYVMALRSRVGRWPALRMFLSMAARRIPAALFYTSIAVYVLGVLMEFRTAFMPSTLYDEDATAKYSGEFDWVDVGAYTMGMAAMTLNYIFVAPRVRRKI